MQYQFSLLLLSSLAALASSASIQKRGESPWPSAVREFFSAVGEEIKEFKAGRSSISRCDLSDAILPTTTNSPLPPPSDGLSLFHVAMGRGTQNYTCGSDPNAPPVQVGAVAHLYNASCLSAVRPRILSLIPAAILSFPTPRLLSLALFPSNLLASGEHYFPDSKTPVFNLHTEKANYGIYFGKKVANTTAPEGSAKGPDGGAAVPWLKLQVLDPAVGALEEDTRPNVKEIYRVNTAGGSPPATCAGRTAGPFQVEYAAEYWFFAPGPASAA